VLAPTAWPSESRCCGQPCEGSSQVASIGFVRGIVRIGPVSVVQFAEEPFAEGDVIITCVVIERMGYRFESGYNGLQLR